MGPVRPPILTIEDLTVALPVSGDRPFAVRGVSLLLQPAEILCVVGESGSGKSILSAALMGALPRGLSITGGRIALGTQDLSALSQAAWRDIRGRRIAMIPQEPLAALNPSMRVGRQIEEVFAIHKRLSPADRRTEALRLIREMHLPDAERIAAAYPHELSGGQCQRICICMALALGPEVLIADEPTTALDVTTQAQVLKLICELRDRHGQAVLFITHDLGVVADIADRVAVMEKGELVEVGSAQDVLRSPTHPYTRKLIDAVPSFVPPARRNHLLHTLEKGRVRAEGVTKTFGSAYALKNACLTVEPGTTLAIVGGSGSGKSTLARVLVGLMEPTSGLALVNGQNLGDLRGGRLRRARRSVQMIFQDPYGSLNPRRSVGPMIARAARLAGDDPATVRTRAKDLLQKVGLSPEAYYRRPSAFSGGQRQRIGIARALAVRPDILIADESVSALDVSVQAQILELLGSLQEEFGLTIVFITHDLRVAAQVSDHIAVMQAGEIIEIGEAAILLGAPKHAYTRSLLAAAPGRGAI